MVSNFNIKLSIWLLLDFKRLKAWLMAKPFNIVPGECAYSPSAATPQLREILCPWVKNAWRDQTRSTGCSHSHILVNVSLRYCVWGTRTQPLISVGLLCIVRCPVQLISEFFWDCICVDTHLPRFEALAYVLPHFDALTHVVIRVSSAFIFQTFAEVCYSVFVKRSPFKSLLNLRKAYIFQEFAEGLLSICVCWIFQNVHL